MSFFGIFELQCSKKLIKPAVFGILDLRCSRKLIKPSVFLAFLVCDDLAMFQKACKTCRFFDIFDLRWYFPRSYGWLLRKSGQVQASGRRRGNPGTQAIGGLT